MAYLGRVRIVRTARYLKDMKRLGATEADVLRLETEIAESPTAGMVIPGLGSLRKIRFSIGNRGKRGGGRAIYYLALSEDTVLMLFAYDKADQADLTPEQRRQAHTLVRELKK